MSKPLLKFILPAILVGVITLLFNNCGQQAFNTEQASIPVEKQQQDMVQLYKAGFAPSECANPEMYECLQKVFSQDLQNEKRDVDFPCVKLADGHEVCLSGEQFTYNSSAAVKACGENCTDNYEFQEFTCAYKLPNANGDFPLRATAEQFEAALVGTYQACLKVAVPAVTGDQ